MRLLERYIYYTLLATLPFQLGKHFWPNFSLVSGIRVDYLSPTLFLSDIFLLLLLVVFIIRIKKIPLCFTNKFYYCFLVAGCIALPFAREPLVIVLGMATISGALFFGYFTALFVKENTLTPVLYILSLSALVVVSIEMLQFVAQKSINGPFYYLGERSFQLHTIGIATFSFLGNDLLRPYATFPHPNALAYFLFIALVCVVFLQSYLPYPKKISWIISAILLLGILITFSRIIILVSFIVICVKFWKKIPSRYVMLVFALFIVILFSVLRIDTLFRDSGFRFEGLRIAVQLWFASPLWGVGLNNFYYHEIELQKVLTPTLLQPVHNVYLLTLSQMGIMGGVVFFTVVVRIIAILRMRMETKAYNARFYWMGYILLVTTLVVGLFDHYLLTLHQGIYFASFALGLCCARVKGQE